MLSRTAKTVKTAKTVMKATPLNSTPLFRDPENRSLPGRTVAATRTRKKWSGLLLLLFFYYLGQTGLPLNKEENLGFFPVWPKANRTKNFMLMCLWACIGTLPANCRSGDSARTHAALVRALFSQVHPPSKKKLSKRFETLRSRLLRWRLALFRSCLSVRISSRNPCKAKLLEVCFGRPLTSKKCSSFLRRRVPDQRGLHKPLGGRVLPRMTHMCPHRLSIWT